MVAGLALVALVVVLRTGDRDPTPAPERPTTTTTSAPAPRDTPSRRWSLGAGGHHQLSSVRDLERGRTVVELRRTSPGPGLGAITSTVRPAVGEVVTFTADLKVTGTGRAWIGLGGFVSNIGTGGEDRGLEGANTSEQPVAAGAWERRTLTFTVPDGTTVLARVVLDGDGSVLVDPVELPE